MTSGRHVASIFDYPEHLNPFHEDDNHSRLRFWDITKKKTRSNSFTFQSIKDFRHTLSFRSKKRSESNSQTSSPTVVVRRTDTTYTLPNSRQTIATPNRYVHQGSITPLPRSRFSERVRNLESERQNNGVTLRRTSLSTSNNPFDTAENDLPSRPASALSYHSGRSASPAPQITPRKKKKAPLPPPVRDISHETDDISVQTSENNQVQIVITSPESKNVTSTEAKVVVKTEDVIIAEDLVKTREVVEPEEVIKTENILEKSDNISTKSEHSTLQKLEDTLDTCHISNNVETSTSQNSDVALEVNCHISTNVETSTLQNSDVVTLKVDLDKSDQLSTPTKATIENSADIVINRDSIDETSDRDISKETEIILENSEKHETTDVQKEQSIQDISVNTKNKKVVNMSSDCHQTDSDTFHDHVTNSDIEILNEIQMKLETEQQCIEDYIAANDSENCSLNYNAEYILSTEHSSVTPANSEESINYQKQTMDDATAELQEIVDKLHLEVNKLTDHDDTNNNLIFIDEGNDSRYNSRRRYYAKGTSVTSSEPNSPRVKTAMNVTLGSNGSDSSDSDYSNPMSSKLVRLRRDDAWIRN